MSSKKYQELLRDAEKKLLSYQEIAEGWRQISNDQTHTMAALNKVLDLTIGSLANMSPDIDEKNLERLDGSHLEEIDNPNMMADCLGANIETLVVYSLEVTKHYKVLTEDVESKLGGVSSLSTGSLAPAFTSLSKVGASSHRLAERILKMEKSAGANGSSNYSSQDSGVVRANIPRRGRKPALLAPDALEL